MWLKFLFFIVLFFLVACFQYGFLPYLSILNTTPNLIFILLFIVFFFEKPGEYKQSIVMALLAGFILDAFSLFNFGPAIISLFLVYALIKMIFYFLKEKQDDYLFIYFISIFLICFMVYGVLVVIATHFLQISFAMPWNFFAALAYNLLVALVGFYLYKRMFEGTKDRQLKLRF